MNIGKNIIVLRKMQDITQEELAYKMGVSRQTIHKWEYGFSYPKLRHLEILSNIFNITIDQLIKEELIITHEIKTESKSNGEN